MSSERLLPCPFCGGEARIWHVAGRGIAKCSVCGCMTSAMAKDARKAWNRREGAKDGD